MMIDASALTAILLREPDAPALAARIAGALAPFTTPIAIYETMCALMRVNTWSASDAEATVRQLLAIAGIQVVAIPAEVAWGAAAAFEKFGKGRHPAALNLGDCFAYAAARACSAPLLFKGDDFTRTDIESALV